MRPCLVFFFNDTATTEIYTLSLHDALPISLACLPAGCTDVFARAIGTARSPADASRRLAAQRSEEHTSELQSRQYLVCRLLLEKKKKKHLGEQAQPSKLLDNFESRRRHLIF